MYHLILVYFQSVGQNKFIWDYVLQGNQRHFFDIAYISHNTFILVCALLRFRYICCSCCAFVYVILLLYIYGFAIKL